MSKHSLISTVAGLGLMAASMGASAQLQTFDYSMMFYGGVGTGGKYVAFVPTMNRGAGPAEGAAGVLMLEMFQPASGSASTWAYAIGGAVGASAGAGSATGTDVVQTIEWTANNSLPQSERYYFGNNEAIKLAFLQPVAPTGTPAMNCNVSFSAEIGTNGQLGFNNVNVQPDHADWKLATAVVSLYSHSSQASPQYTIAASDWGSSGAAATDQTTGVFAATTPAVAGLSAKIDGVAGGSYGGTIVGSLVNMRNRCVAAYNARATSGGVTPIVGSGIGLMRIW